MSSRRLWWGLYLQISLIFAEPSQPLNITLFTVKQSWNEGYAICRNNNQTLLTIENEKKNLLIATITSIWVSSLYLTNDYWIGLFDIDPPNGNYTWANCNSIGTFSVWDSGEPNEQDTSMCIRVYQYNKKWRTFFCDDYYQVICENKLESCWYEEFKAVRLSGFGLLGYGGYTKQQCINKCTNMVVTDKECVAISFDDSAGICRLLVDDRVYITSEPLTYASPSYTTSVKRCYEYNVVPDFNGTENKLRTPDHYCSERASITRDVHLPADQLLADSTVSARISSEVDSSVYQNYVASDKQGVLDIFLDSSYSEAYRVTDSTQVLEGSSQTYHSNIEPSTSFPVAISTLGVAADLYQSSSVIQTEPTFVISSSVICPCKCFTQVDDVSGTKEAEIIAEIQKELIINTTSLSSFKRKLYSAEDNRSSAVVVGSIGIGFLGSIMLFVAILDFNHLLRGMKNVLAKYKNSRISVLYESK